MVSVGIMNEPPSITTLLSSYKVPIALGVGSLLLIALSLVLLVKSTQTATPIEFTNASSSGVVAGAQMGEVTVDVAGAVVTPGVYTFSSGSRVDDAIKAAGGLSDEADTAWIEKQLNRAALLKDGVKLYIPKMNEKSSTAVSQPMTSYIVNTASSGDSQNGLISVNQASQSELESLPGVGPVTAGKIIAGRPYGSIEELLAKKIVGNATFQKIKDQISL